MPYPTSIKFWINIDAGWTDITSYVIRDVVGEWGMSGNGPLDLLANTGTMTLILNNDTGKFAPGLVGAYAGWGKGTPVKLVIIFDEVEYKRFYGVVDDLDIQGGSFGGEIVTAIITDWMNYAVNHPLIGQSNGSNQRGEEMLATILADMSIQPQVTDFDVGVNTFLTSFDAIKSKTKAYSEISKITFSEIGATYLKKDRDFGETLVFENAEARHGHRELESIPVFSTDADLLLKEDGDHLLLESGDHFILDEVQTFVADNIMKDIEIIYGENVINSFANIAYPREVIASQTLFELEDPIFIPSGVTITGIRGSFRDPDGGSACGGINMINPVVTTDYLMNTKRNGTGVNISADLTVTPNYGVEGPNFTLVNANAAAGWITKLNYRGDGVYFYNPIEKITEDQDSIDEFSKTKKTLHQKYQQELTRGSLAGAKYLERDKRPQSKLNKLFFSANRSNNLMIAFLHLDVGHVINAIEDRSGIDEYDYIQGIQFVIKPGGIINYSWVVRSSFSLLDGNLSKISCEFDKGSTDGVNYGYLPQISADTITDRTFIADIYLHTVPDANDFIIMGPAADGGGDIFYVDYDVGDAGEVFLTFETNRFDGASGKWRCPADAFAINTWVRVGVTYLLNDSAGDPIIYIDGVSQVLTEIDTPAGVVKTEVGAQFVIGNMKTSTVNYTRAFDGLIKNPCAYDAILSQAQMTADDAGTLETDNLVLQGFCVRTSELSDFEDLTLTAAEKMIDNMFGMVGTPNGSVITRLI